MRAATALVPVLLAACVVEPLRVPDAPCRCPEPVVPVVPVCSVLAPPEPEPPPKPREVVTSIDGTVVEVRFPLGPARGNILVLPGWGFDRRAVCWSSSFCDDARAAGYVVVLAGMDKSIYAGEIYPQTRADVAIQKTRGWVLGRLVPELQARHEVLRPDQDNYLYGMSTGGRGVALLALHGGALFKAGAALSGDFDMLLETKDPLLLLHYGPAKRFPERWSGEDNPALHAARIAVPLFIASGAADTTVPAAQSIAFHKRMVEAHPDLDVRLVLVEGATHDFAFWGSQTESVLAFFAAHASPAPVRAPSPVPSPVPAPAPGPAPGPEGP